MASSSSSSSSSDTQGPVFWERLRGLFEREERPAGEERPEGEKRRRAVAIALCFLASCVLWFVFTLQDTHTVPIDIPTTVQNGQGAQALATLPPSTVRAQIEGQGAVLLRYFFENPSIAIGTEESQVNVERLVNAQLPGDATLKRVDPSVLHLEREPRLERTVPVRLRGTISTPPTHALMADPRLQPDSIRISGARSLVSSIGAWPTVPVDHTNLTDSLRRSVPLSDTLSGLVERSAGSVVLRAQSRQFTEGMRSIDVRVTGAPENAVNLDPSSIRVTYRTLVDEYQAAQQTDRFYATVSYEQIRTDTTGRVEPRIQTPQDLTIRNVEPITPELGYFFVAEGG